MKNACSQCGSKIFYVLEPFVPKALCKACETKMRKTSHYVGDGMGDQTVDLGFQPDAVFVQPLRGDKAKSQKARCLRALQSAIDRNLDPSDPKIERIITRLKRLGCPWDAVTQKDILASGKIGTIWGAHIQVTKKPSLPFKPPRWHSPSLPTDMSKWTVVRE